MTVKDDVLAVNYLMRQPITENETERVLHALALANYEVRKLPPADVIDARRIGRGSSLGVHNATVQP